jgi:DNA-binding transcriptional LysR family regulator
VDKVDAMRIFVKVAELQSFSRTAEVLNLPKATVSTSVQNLEALVEIKLLNRTTRQVRLTSEGATFLERCKDLLSDLEETESMFKRESSQIQGKIRVDMTTSVAKNFFIPILPTFLKKYPGIEIEVSGTDGWIDVIRENIDCVIRSGDVIVPGLAEKEIGYMEIINVVSPGYLKKFGKPRNLEDLKKHRLVFYSPILGAKPEGFEYFDGDKSREIKMSGAITVNNIDSYKAACLTGLGICQNPLIGVAEYLKSGALVEILPKFRPKGATLKLVYQERRMLSKRVRVFMDWLEPALKKYLQTGKI